MLVVLRLCVRSACIPRSVGVTLVVSSEWHSYIAIGALHRRLLVKGDAYQLLVPVLLYCGAHFPYP